MLLPQDIFVVVGVAHLEDDWTYERLADHLGMPVSQVYKSLARADESRLFIKDSRRVVKQNLTEFLVHGARYAFPARPGHMSRGIPAGWGAPGLSELMVEGPAGERVWPSPTGTVRGQTVQPLHGSLPMVAVENPELHAIFALIDLIRVGSARERSVAAQELERRFS